MDGEGEACHDADEPVVTASVFKVAVALEVFCQVAAGRLDPGQRVRLTPSACTPGPTGISVFGDDVEVSVRDLALLMLSVSDNAATDALIDLAGGVEAINGTLRSLGLSQTVVPVRLGEYLDWIGQAAGYGSWAGLERATITPEDEPATASRMLASRAFDPFRTIRSTARETATLLRLIWRDEAGPPAACAEVRRMMALQVTRQRIALGFPRGGGVRIAAKSGTLLGLIRNESAVISYPDNSSYAVAVFTRAHAQWEGEHEINAAIGRAAALAVDCLRPARELI